MEELSQTASTWSKTVLIIAKQIICLEVFNHFLPKDSFENFDNMRGEGYWSIISWDGLTVFFVKRDDMRQFVGSRDISISQGVRPNEVDGNCDRIFAIFEKCSRHFIRPRGSVLVNFVNCSYISSKFWWIREKIITSIVHHREWSHLKADMFLSKLDPTFTMFYRVLKKLQCFQIVGFWNQRVQ